MNTKNNRRLRETNERIIRAVYETLAYEKKPLSKITVREICEKADIHRSTFYAHYMDVFDVVEKVEKNMSEGPLKAFFEKLDEGGTAEECFSGYLTYIFEYQEFYRIYLNEARVFSSVEILFEGVRERIEKKDDNRFEPARRKSVPSGGVDVRYYGYFAIYGVMAVIRFWLNEGCKETPEEVYQILRSQQYALENMFNW